MRLVTVKTQTGPALAFERGGSYWLFRETAAILGLDARGLDDIHSLLDGGAPALQRAGAIVSQFTAHLGSRGETSSANPSGDVPAPEYPSAYAKDALLAPIPRPRKNVFCVGRNYADHAKERGSAAPRYPVFFTKAPTTVTGPWAKVSLPPQTQQFDYEGELAVIIGRPGKDIPREKAHEHIFGYTIINDLTARDLQDRHVQFFKGKSLDHTCPMGPVIVTADEVGDLASLTIETRVNGEVRQSASLSEMIFDVPTLIAVLSDGMTLEPGDILATGTPAGVGAATGAYLKRGDVVDVTIRGIGTLTTYIV